jgi:hypothetical protein
LALVFNGDYKQSPMAKSRKVQEETIAEKLGHSVGTAIGAIKEKFNDLVHPDEAPPARKTRTTRVQPVVKRSVVAANPRTAKPAVKKPATSVTRSPQAAKKKK